jgi:hypothetical protein
MNRLPSFAEESQPRRHAVRIAWTVPFWFVGAALFLLSLKL